MLYYPEALTKKLTSLFFYRQWPPDRFVTGFFRYFRSDTFYFSLGFSNGSDAHDLVKKEFDVVKCRFDLVFSFLQSRFSCHDGYKLKIDSLKNNSVSIIARFRYVPIHTHK